MNPYHRPEKQLDPAKQPGQIVYRQPSMDKHSKRPLDNLTITPPEAGLYLRDIIARIEQSEVGA